MTTTFERDDYLWQGEPMRGLCGHCQVQVDSTDPNHRVTSIVNGGRGVECVLRGDITPAEGGPLRTDEFGLLPEDGNYCCRGECCGPGSWCCARAGRHDHGERELPVDPERHPHRAHDRPGHVAVPIAGGRQGSADATAPDMTAALVKARLDMETPR